MRSNVSTAVALIAGLIPMGRAACANRVPADTVVVCGVTTVSTAPSQTVLGCAFSNSGATYDLKSGQFSVGAGSKGDAALFANDVFWISGPSSTRPIPFSAQLAIHAGRMYDGFAIAIIHSDDQTQEFTTQDSDFYQILTLPLSEVAGEHFHLGIHLHAWNHALKPFSPATASARLTFSLPPDYVITSDQGYSSVPTPTRETTWGRLKLIYR